MKQQKLSYWILSLTLLASFDATAASTTAFRCESPNMPDGSLLMMNAPLDAVTEATLVRFDDEDEVKDLMSLKAVTRANGLAELEFLESTKVDWSKIDPAKQCYVARTTATLTDFEKITKGLIVGKVMLWPTFLVHPRKRNCSIPRVKPAPAAKMECLPMSLKDL